MASAQDEGYKTCSKCGRSLKASTEFFKMKTGERCDLCKDCLTQYIDNRNPETFMWILEMFDVPYIEKKWTQLTNERYKKNPGKFGPKSVIGLYLRAMNMLQYRDLTYADSDSINNVGKNVTVDEDYEEQLKTRLENGEISQGQYNTLTKTNRNVQKEGYDVNGFLIPEEESQPEEPQEQAPQYQIDPNY